MSHIPVIQRTDLRRITPNRLHDVVDYSVFENQQTFRHREERCDVDRLVSYLGAAIDHAAIRTGNTSEPSALPEDFVLSVVLDALANRHPVWFDLGDATSDLDKPISELSLDVGDLRETYWQGEADAAEIRTIEGDNWEHQKQVIIPLVALVLDELETQHRYDVSARSQAGQESLKMAVMEHIDIYGLHDDEVRATVESAIRTMRL